MRRRQIKQEKANKAYNLLESVKQKVKKLSQVSIENIKDMKLK